MEVILLERIARLGTLGDTVKVRDGFARNFLLPMKKALRATEANKKVFDLRRAEIEAQNAEAKGKAGEQAKTLEGVSVSVIRMASEEGKLYGAVSVRDIAEALEAQGHNVPRNAIQLSPIKMLGEYAITLQLHGEVAQDITLNVVRSES